MSSHPATKARTAVVCASVLARFDLTSGTRVIRAKSSHETAAGSTTNSKNRRHIHLETPGGVAFP